jgi:hypothetical protein
MTAKWYKKGEEALKPGDKIEKSYTGKLDGKFGHIIVSDKRLLFITEKGFISKKYNIILNEPLKDVKIKHKTQYKFYIDSNGSNHEFESIDIPGTIVEKGIQSLLH